MRLGVLGLYSRVPGQEAHVEYQPRRTEQPLLFKNDGGSVGIVDITGRLDCLTELKTAIVTNHETKIEIHSKSRQEFLSRGLDAMRLDILEYRRLGCKFE